MINQQCPACGHAPKIPTPHGTLDRISERTQVKRFYPERRRGNGFEIQEALNDTMMGNKSGNEINSPNIKPEGESGYIHPIFDLDTNVENVCHNIYNEPNFIYGNIDTADCCEHSTVASYTNVLPCENSIIHYRTRQNFIETNIKTNRRGLYLLLIFIMLLLLSNAIGLPLIYAYASKEDNCFECELLPAFTKEDFTAFNISRSEDGTCCVQSTAKALILLLKGSPNQEDVERNYELLNKVLARKRSAIQVKGHGVSKNKIVLRFCDMKSGHLSFDSEGIQISVGGTYSLYSSVRFKKGYCPKRRILGYRVRATGTKGQTLTLASVHHSCWNGTNFEQDFSSQTIFQVPLGNTYKVFIEISEGNKDLLQQHHYHSLSVFEI